MCVNYVIPGKNNSVNYGIQMNDLDGNLFSFN